MARTKSKRREFKHYSSDPQTQAFFLKHSEKAPPQYVKVKGGGRLVVFVDGSSAVSGGLGGWESLQSGQNKSPYERAQTLVQYRKAVAVATEVEFERYKMQLDGDRAEYIGDKDGEIAKLTKLRDAARRARRKLRKAEEQLEAVTPAPIARTRKHHARMKAAAAAFRNKVQNIRL